jgi:hypothetical protein
MTQYARIIACQCVICGAVTYQPSYDMEDRFRNFRPWFCGCSPPPHPARPAEGVKGSDE